MLPNRPSAALYGSAPTVVHVLRFLPICRVKKGFPLLSCISFMTTVVEHFPTHLEAFVLFFYF